MLVLFDDVLASCLAVCDSVIDFCLDMLLVRYFELSVDPHGAGAGV